MQNVLFRMSETPGAIRHAGKALVADNDEIYRGRLGLSEEDLRELRERHVI
jgi:crotonobetainyl-CoA:carnitine CoA-transferase CaiB-like acyl-CoA transferase